MPYLMMFSYPTSVTWLDFGPCRSDGRRLSTISLEAPAIFRSIVIDGSLTVDNLGHRRCHLVARWGPFRRQFSTLETRQMLGSTGSISFTDKLQQYHGSNPSSKTYFRWSRKKPEGWITFCETVSATTLASWNSQIDIVTRPMKWAWRVLSCYMPLEGQCYCSKYWRRHQMVDLD